MKEFLRKTCFSIKWHVIDWRYGPIGQARNLVRNTWFDIKWFVRDWMER